MYEYIEGEFIEKSPAHMIVEASQLAYYINISVFTYSQLSAQDGRVVKTLELLTRNNSFCGVWMPVL